MEDVFDQRLAALNKGVFPYPVSRDRRFSFTCQHDVPRFVAERCLQASNVDSLTFNFDSPGTFSVREIEQALTEASGRTIRATDKFPAYYRLIAEYPYRWLRRQPASRSTPLIRYFDRHGCTDPGTTVRDLFPDFPTTTLHEHLATIWPRHDRGAA